ncbi:hypothetical protein ACUNO0_000171 [Campylobacter jejuni]
MKNYNGRDISGIALGYERAYLEHFSTSFSVISSFKRKSLCKSLQNRQ